MRDRWFYAALVAGKLGHLSLLQTLKQAFVDSDHKVREVAGEALSAFGSPAVASLTRYVRSEEWGVKTEAIRALQRIDDAEARRVLDDLRAIEQNYEILKLLEPPAPAQSPAAVKADRERPLGRRKGLFGRGSSSH
jgi:HEAT repeat protein